MRETAQRPAEGGARTAGSTAQWLIEELKRAIVEMELVPGTWLSEQEIALRYGVSRQPVREALIMLSHAHLVETRPQRGSVVCHLSVERMREARFLRQTIECAIIRAASERFDPAVSAEIEAILAQQAVHARHGNRKDFQRADAAFHEALARGAGFPSAWELIQQLKLHTDRICKLTLAEPAILASLTEQHRAIHAAVLARDPDEAERLMADHLLQIMTALPEIQRDYAQWFA